MGYRAVQPLLAIEEPPINGFWSSLPISSGFVGEVSLFELHTHMANHATPFSTPIQRFHPVRLRVESPVPRLSARGFDPHHEGFGPKKNMSQLVCVQGCLWARS